MIRATVQPDATLSERLFPLLSAAVMALFATGGFFLNSITAPPFQESTATSRAIRTEFLIQEKPRPVPESTPVAPTPRESAPIDLTQKPVMNQKEDDITSPPAPEAKPVRRVYGLRKVYSVGIGSGGSLSDAVIGKLGNTLSGEIDTVTATDADLKGAVVSITTVTRAPKFRKVVKPQYTPEMLENKVTGVVRVRVLVDIDGRVKKALALNDIGHGAATEAMKACLNLEFEPAMQGEEPRAVWIVVPIRFELLG